MVGRPHPQNADLQMWGPPEISCVAIFLVGLTARNCNNANISAKSAQCLQEYFIDLGTAPETLGLKYSNPRVVRVFRGWRGLLRCRLDGFWRLPDHKIPLLVGLAAQQQIFQHFFCCGWPPDKNIEMHFGARNFSFLALPKSRGLQLAQSLIQQYEIGRAIIPNK